MASIMSQEPASPSVPDASPHRGWWRTFRGWPWPARWACYVVVALVLLLVAGLVTAVVLVRRPFPQTTGTATLPGLVGEVEVIRDSAGIPQLYGDSIADLMRAQGYVHAQERFFEMDVRRHLTAGRLSEMFGETTLETDKYIRTMGWRRVAEQELALVAPDTRAALQAYADGVNAYLDTHGPTQIAVEYTLLRAGGLDYTPEEWTPVDSLAWLKAMAWDLRGNMTDEVDRVLTRVNHTAAQVARLYPPYPYEQHQPIVTGGAVVDGEFEQDAAPPSAPVASSDARQALARVSTGLGRLPEMLGRGSGLGSNSWVVDADHSETGAPLLANDPHLGISLPGIWVQMGLHCRTVSADCPLDVAGFTFSGVPGVIIGHNADIAWGFTNLGPDVTDLFLERVQGGSYRYAGRLRPLATRTETIKVRDGEDFQLVIRETVHGPLLSDVSTELSSVGANAEVPGNLDRGPGFAVSLAWTALTPSRTADAILKLDLATGWEDFRAAARDFDVPAQNLLYADREGHIGYQAPGRVPIRGPGNDGSVPTEGWLPENDWTGEYVPFAALPHVLDPQEGYLVTANQAVTGPGYPYFLGADWARGYRSQRIRDLLSEKGRLSVQEMADLQLDDLNPMAPTLVPYLLDIADLGSPYYRAGQRLLADWDFHQPPDSAAAAYYNVVWANVLRLTFHDELRESLWPDGEDRWFGVMETMLRRPQDTWWDDRGTDEVVETREDILREAMRDARDELTRRQALDPSSWSWGELHRLDLRSATLGESGIGPVEWLVNREGYAVGGGTSIVDATGWDAAEGYQVSTSPSMRMVVSLADLDDSRWVNLTGVSGHPFDEHYVDQTDLWVAGETLPWPFSRAAVESAGQDTLTLRPAG